MAEFEERPDASGQKTGQGSRRSTNIADLWCFTLFFSSFSTFFANFWFFFQFYYVMDERRSKWLKKRSTKRVKRLIT